MKNKTYWIAETAVMIALLVALQWATKPLGQFVTGSCVNLVLGVSTLVGGVWCGAVVAIASPFCAFLVGVGPAKLLIVPFIAVGNVVLVLLLHFIAGGKPLSLRSYLAVAAAAVCKFAALFLLVTKVAIPALGLPEAAAATLSASFSWPQLVTAAIGGVIAVTIAPVIRKALVELDGKPFRFFAEHRAEWAAETCYVYPGAIQYFGPREVCDLTTRTLALEKA